MGSDGFLDVRAVSVGYGKSKVLDSASMSVPLGEIVGLTGANGAGKTTLLRAVSSAVPLMAGSITLAGGPLPASQAQSVRAGVSHVPEGRQCFGALTVEENLRVSAYGAGRSLTAADIAHLLEVFPQLDELMDRRSGLLSGGQQQMLAIGRGLVAHPRLLLVDELSLGLAPKLTLDMWAAVRAVRDREEIAMLVVDQNARQLLQQCDRVYTVERGRLEEIAEITDDGRPVPVAPNHDPEKR